MASEDVPSPAMLGSIVHFHQQQHYHRHMFGYEHVVHRSVLSECKLPQTISKKRTEYYSSTVIEGSSRKYNPCGKRRNHSNSDKLGTAKYQALAVGIFCRDCEHPYNPLVGGRVRGYP